MTGDLIHTHDALLDQLEEAGVQPVNNAVMSARIGPPPPDMQVLGMAPPGAYDGQAHSTVSENTPVLQALVEKLPEPAVNIGFNLKPGGLA